jgi:hypothetical protein
MVPDVVCPPANGVTDPAASVPDERHFPLTNPDSTAPAERNLEVFRGLSELELIKLLGQLQELGSASVPLPPTSGVPEEVGRSTSPHAFSVPVTGNTIRLDTMPPGFQPRLIAYQESTYGFSPAGVTESAPISGLPPAGGTGYEGVAAGLPAALGVHFQLFLYSFRRVRKPEVAPRFHFRFVDPIPDMESLLLPLEEVPQFNRLLTRATLISGER